MRTILPQESGTCRWTTEMRLVIKDILTVTMNDRNDIDRYTIVIEKDRIQSVSKNTVQIHPGDTVIDGSNRIAIPGFINGHIHCDITLARGLGDGLTLYEQDHDSSVSRKRWFRDELDAEARFLGRMLQYIEAVKGGTVFLCDVPFWWSGDDLISPFKEIGITGAVVLDYRTDFLTGKQGDISRYFKTADTLRQNGILPIVEGPAEEDFQEDLLLMLHDRADELDTFIQMHLAETKWREDIIRKRYGTTSVHYLEDIHFMSERVIGSHGVYISEDEQKILSNRGARIVNCPTAEMKISDGIAPVASLIKRGVATGLGIDGALWNDSASMFSEMKTLLLLQRVLSHPSTIQPYDCLYAATRGGAEVFDLGNELGSIEPGKRACIAIINFFTAHLLPLYHKNSSNILQNIVTCAQSSDVEIVIIDGTVVVEGGHMKTVNENDVFERCQKLARDRFEGMIFR
jgi:5-methylthioadenosine/S-adenosylhomocysteine deaminase